MSKISVIIPAYNAQNTILKTIESVRQQTFEDLEIIVVNDGSTDRTLEIVNTIEDTRIKVFDYPNGGVATARNRGIEKARGDYIAFLDADDWWTNDKLALQLKALTENSQAGLAYSWTYFFYEKTQECFSSEPVYYQGNVYSQLLLKNFLHHGSNPLIRRQAIESVGNFNSKFPHCADWDYYLRLAAEWDFVVVPQHQIYYLQSANSMTSKISAIERQLCQMLDLRYTQIPSNLKPLKKRSKAWIYQYCTQQYLEYGKDFKSLQNAIIYLGKAFLAYPPIIGQKYTYDLIKWCLKKTLVIHS